ncbi:hypothetical protein [Leptospira kanakyensis]|uniref:hypothetical protein n=1 Tax=Leptospira kanakyensis TaxID=2484968 RepID=UPI00223E78CE|nr:hypothetical protein [Leptospira kanakyensis]MCW7471795.1 hypothetical protein [Leptospira kanakyensis]MCW7483277.1 hypothetical protein [Leptospira kanakyensis]
MNIRKPSTNRVFKIETKLSLERELNLLLNADRIKYSQPRKLNASKILDLFLLSGKYNSVLGYEGYQIFKNQIKELIKNINENNFKSNLINLTDLYEIILDSGIYYNYDFIPIDFKEMKNDERWLTAYRYIAYNFPKISYGDFRKIVIRFEETKGHSFYIEPNDSTFLKSTITKSKLFKEVFDTKAKLLKFSQKDLKNICSTYNIQSARSNSETIDRLLELIPEDEIHKLLPKDKSGDQNYKIIDLELASGDDIIKLDYYIRQITKAIRDDLFTFIEERRKSFLELNITAGQKQ